VTCTETGAAPPDCPAVTQVSGSGAGPYSIGLSNAIPPGECTTIEFTGTVAGQRLQYQSLPGDVDMNGVTNHQDLLALIAAMNNGSANQFANLPRYNINRTGPIDGQDIARLVQLLNGVQSPQAFNGIGVAACP
jgi:hypothetical protein